MLETTNTVGQHPPSKVLRFDWPVRSDLENYVKRVDLGQQKFASEPDGGWLGPINYPYKLVLAYHYVRIGKYLIVEVGYKAAGLAYAYQFRKKFRAKIELVTRIDGDYLAGAEIFNAQVFFKKTQLTVREPSTLLRK